MGAEDLQDQVPPVERQPDAQQTTERPDQQPGRIEVSYPDGEQPNDAAETSPVATETVNEASEYVDEPTHITSIAHDNESNPGWDVNKAETVAAAIKADGSFDNIIKDRDERRERSDRIFAEKNPKVRLEARERIRARTQEAIDQEISPYEELYDLNPEAFAKMPTEEFMKATRPLVEATKRLRVIEEDFANLKSAGATIERCIEEKSLVSESFIESFLSEAAEDLRLDDDEFLKLQARFDDVRGESSFDQTPRQIMESYRQLAGECIAKFEEVKEGAEQRRQAILDQHQPQTPASEQQ